LFIPQQSSWIDVNTLTSLPYPTSKKSSTLANNIPSSPTTSESMGPEDIPKVPHVNLPAAAIHGWPYLNELCHQISFVL
jgi:hypothetical protein